MPSMNLLKVGDTVRVFTKKQIETYVEAGGDDLKLLECHEDHNDVEFSETFEIKFVDFDEDSNSKVYHKGGYLYPEEILELVEIGE